MGLDQGKTDATAQAIEPAQEITAGPETATPAASSEETLPKAKLFVDDVRASIAARHDAFRNTELHNDPSLAAARQDSEASMGIGTEEQAEPNGDLAPVEPAAAVAPLAPQPAQEPAPFTRVKVNGKSYDVPTNEVQDAGGVAAFQILAAQQLALRETKSLNTELRQALAQARAPATAAAPIASATPAAASSAAVDDMDVARELTEAAFESDVPRVAKALGRLRAVTQQQPQAAPAQPAPPAPPKQRTQQEVLAANAVFDNEFRALADNPEAFAEARRQVVEKMNDPALANTPLDMIVRDTASRIQRIAAPLRPVAPAAPAPTSVQQTFAQRQALKARLPATASPGALPAQVQPKPVTREATASQYIANLRRASGSNAVLAERKSAAAR